MFSGVLFGLLCAACWATGSAMMKGPSQKLDPVTLNAPRTLVGALATLVIALAMGRGPAFATLNPQNLFFLVGSILVGGAVGDSLYVASLSRIGLSRAYPIANSYPALTLAFGVLALQEQVDWPIIGGLVLVLAGVMLISRPRGSLEASAAPASGTGVWLALAASVFWAVAAVMLAPGLVGLDALMVTAVRLAALSAALWGVVAARRTWGTLRLLTPREWLLVVVGGFIGWGIGTICFVLAVADLGPTRAAIITSTAPLFALPLSVLFLRERLNLAVLGGTVLTVLGVVLIS